MEDNEDRFYDKRGDLELEFLNLIPNIGSTFKELKVDHVDEEVINYKEIQ